MNNGETYLLAIDTFHEIKSEYEHKLKTLLLDKKGYEMDLMEPIKMHCPRGFNEDMVITHLQYKSNNLTLYYCTKENKMFTRHDFGAEDFVDMVYKIIRDNF